MALPFIIRAMGVPAEDYSDFLSKELYNYPSILILINILHSVFAFLLPAVVFVYLADPEPWAYLGLTKPVDSRQLSIVVGLGIVIIPVVGLLANWIKEIDLGGYSQQLDEQRSKMLQQYLSSGSIGKMLLNVFFIGLVPAVCEELFFRGVIQRFAHTWLKKWWLSVVVSALVFAFWHFSISEFIPIFIAGFLIGWVYYLTSNLWLSILLHFLNNGLQVVLAYAEARSAGVGNNIDGFSWVSVLVFGASLLVLIFFVYLLEKYKSPLPQSWSVVFKERETVSQPE